MSFLPAPLRHRRRTLWAVLLGGLLMVTGCSTGHDATAIGGSFTFVSPGGKSEFSYPAADRQKLDELAGPDLSGTSTIKLSDYLGKVVVLNFWGSWCAPCRAEAPAFQAASQQLKPLGVQFIGINVKDEQGAGAAFNAAKGVTYPSIFDFQQRTLLSLRGYPTTAIPSTIVVDRQGRVAHIWLTEVDSEQLTSTVGAVAAEK